MAKKQFVMLAQKYDDSKHNIARQMISEKLDGMRCIYDGGITRGVPAAEVPWANCAKHDRLRNQVVATGLWSRYCQPIQAPAWFLDGLPPIPLDGELWAGRGKFQTTMSTCRKLEPDDSEWRKIRYAVFDSPPLSTLLEDRTIDEPQISLEIKGAWEWAIGRQPVSPTHTRPFADVCEILPKLLQGTIAYWHDQIKLPDSESEAKAFAEQFAKRVAAEGGEGAMIRYKWSYWQPCRTYDLLKVKPLNDMEGTVIGYSFGRRTNKGSKLLGKMGAALIRLDNGKTFELSGFTDLERELTPSEAAYDYACARPGERAPDWIEAVRFPRGTRVTFRYRELSDDGIPKEARYARIDPEKQTAPLGARS